MTTVTQTHTRAPTNSSAHQTTSATSPQPLQPYTPPSRTSSSAHHTPATTTTTAATTAGQPRSAAASSSSPFSSLASSPSASTCKPCRPRRPPPLPTPSNSYLLPPTTLPTDPIHSTYLTLTAILLTHLAPPDTPPTHRLHTLLSTWRGPADSSSPSAASLSLFTDAAARSGVAPVPCHSHNDYWRPVPLFSALAAGCVGVEADIWLPEHSPTSEEKGENMSSSSSSPPVGHTRPTLDDPARTLRALYIEPLVAILSAANAGTTVNETGAAPAGVFATSPATTLVLLLDFKEWDAALWDAVVQRELAPLRERGWLTYWSEDERKRVERPVTVVVTGAAAFEAVEGLSGPGGRNVFFDAPLERLERDGEAYNAANSYYASVKLSKAVGGRVWGLRGLSGRQAGVVRRQVAVAAEKGLVSRYWGTPGWPVVLRNRVWETLVESGVGVLNVDELTTAARWDWRLCTVLGITICN